MLWPFLLENDDGLSLAVQYAGRGPVRNGQVLLIAYWYFIKNSSNRRARKYANWQYNDTLHTKKDEQKL